MQILLDVMKNNPKIPPILGELGDPFRVLIERRYIMKAKTLPLFIALAALGLTACGPTVSESSGTTTETSETPVQTDTSETTPPPCLV